MTTVTDPKKAEGFITKFRADTKWNPTMSFTFAGALRYTQYGFIKKYFMTSIGQQLPEDKRPKDNQHDYEYTNWESVDHFVDDFVKVVEQSK